MCFSHQVYQFTSSMHTSHILINIEERSQKTRLNPPLTVTSLTLVWVFPLSFEFENSILSIYVSLVFNKDVNLHNNVRYIVNLHNMINTIKLHIWLFVCLYWWKIWTPHAFIIWLLLSVLNNKDWIIDLEHFRAYFFNQIIPWKHLPYNFKLHETLKFQVTLTC